MTKLYVVGMGPGATDHMTPAARAAIEAADVVAGYKTYLDLIPELLEGKRILSSGMRQEVERCRLALREAAAGHRVALVSSGDAGIYGMAGLVLELADEQARARHAAPLRDVEIEIVPGVSAVQAAAARLGAPLMHDFAVISLSDLLTPWQKIRERLEAAARADFVVALYNPKSRGRTGQILEAREILLRHRAGTTPVGIVRNATRDNETVTVSELEHFTDHAIDMFSLVIIGNAATRLDPQGRMLTPRGYSVRSEETGVRSGKSSPLTPHRSPAADKKCPALFVGGTGSDVGKSVLAAGLCRVLRRRGVRVVPFKAQNMALNSAVTPEGGEIGRAQALQALACGLPPHTDMNPVLLKPNSDTGSQVIVQGRAVGNMTVGQYHAFKAEAFEKVSESYFRLAARHEAVVIEGAGSIAEINLKEHDITNLRMAAMARAPVVLVADIDRGGVFASIVGTVSLLEPEERALLAGIVINRFRGDAALLRPGIEAIEARTGVPVLGVVPWLDLRLPEEDSVALGRKGKRVPGGAVRIGVVRLPRISNYTDFDPLEQDEDVDLVYLEEPGEVAGCDLLILPGTKSTLADLAWLRESGFERAIGDYHAAGGRVIGICGGYQMLGKRIVDPHGTESSPGEAAGIGLLDVETTLLPGKETHQAEGTPLPSAEALGFAAPGRVTGYEIHTGRTVLGPAAAPLWRLTRLSPQGGSVDDGATGADGRVWGTYLHGLFENDDLRRALLGDLRARKGLAGAVPTGPHSAEDELDRLADHLERHIDLEKLWRRAGIRPEEAPRWTG